MTEINRRTALRGLGTLVALPWLDAMTGSSLLAAGNSLASAIHPVGVANSPLRTAFFYVPNGMHMPDWTPEKTGANFELKSILQPLEAFKSKINILSGLTLNGARALGDGPGDHARSGAAFLTGAHPKKTDGAGIHNGPSIDQLLAEHVGGQTRLPSLEVGMESSATSGNCDSGYSCVYSSNISWRTATTPVAKDFDPASLFDRLFGSADELESKQASAQRRKNRKSVLDYVRGEAKVLHQHLGSADRNKLDEYLYSIREVESRLLGTDKLDRPEEDVPDYPRPAGVPRDYAEHMKLLADVMALAFQTDSTRTLSFMFANEGSNRSYREIGVKNGHHEISHHGNDEKKQKQISQINTFHMELFRYFVEKLNSVPEGESTLLDNTLIVYGSGIADGNRHDHGGLPIMTIGSGGGRFVTGQHLEFEKDTPLTNLYMTILDQAGSQAESVGDSTGTLDQVLIQ